MASAAHTAAAYCAEQVRRHDRDRFLCALFAEPPVRADLMALYAFYDEVARIPTAVSEPLIGHMRVQWWQDRLDGIYAGEGMSEGHPVGQALAAAIRRRPVRRADFEPLFEAVGDVLDGVECQDLAGLEDRAQATAGTVVALSLPILGVDDETTFEAGRHVGIAWHLLGRLRAIPYREQGGRPPFPLAWGDGGGCRDDWLADSVARLADVAAGHLATARRVGRKLPRAALPALLPATLADGYLKRLRGNGHDPYDRRLRATGAGGMARLAFNAWRGRF